MPDTSVSSTARAVFVLAAICTLVELFLIAGDLGVVQVSHLRSRAYEYGGFWPGLLGNWRPNYPFQNWLMFLSYGVLHAGPLHLALNMVTLYALGNVLGDRIGGYRFVLLFVVSSLGGGVGYALLSDGFRPMVGASGALFGLAAAVLIWEFEDRLTLKERMWPLARATLFLVALNFALYFAMGGQLAWEAHLGGFLAGLITAVVIGQRPLR